MNSRTIRFLYCLATSLAIITAINGQRISDTLQYRLVVVSQETQEPISYAVIQSGAKGAGTVADVAGMATVAAEQIPLSIRVSAIGYETATFRLTRTDSLYRLALRTDNDLPLITVAEKAREVAVERVHLDNLRLAFLTNWDEELIVTYRRGMTEEHLLVRYDKMGRKLEELRLDLRELSAVSTRCADRLYLITGREVVIIDRVGNRMQAVEKMSRRDYDVLFTGCKLKHDDLFVFEQQGFNGLLRRSSIQPAGGQARLIHEYRSPVLRNYFKDRYLIASNKGIKDILNVDRNIHRTLRDRQSTAIFLETIMYTNDQQNFYFPQSDRLICLDFADRKMRQFNWSGDSLSTQLIPEKAGDLEFLDQASQDPVTGKLYSWAKHKKGYVLFEISANPITTSSRESVIWTNEVARINLSAIEALRILNGKIYAKGKGPLDHAAAGPTLYVADVSPRP